MRRKSMQGGGRSNHSGGGYGGGQRRNNGGGGGYNNNNNRSRKNYPQMREKYLGQAKDALSSGDRVMAEYYFQHADHCYRMMVEEGYRPQSHNPQDNNNQPQESGSQHNGDHNADANADNNAGTDQHAQQNVGDDSMPNVGALPSFLTMGYTAAAAVANVEQAAAAPAQNWEEN